ncbi:MAG: DUF2058 domain-containing protein [Gammaproteobacteria bacterium]|nr:DUF2058 domain-containing protein [Gammaproteobacteria bacterium]
MSSSLRDQLLKAGLVDKAKAKEVAHKQAKQRKAKPPAADAKRKAEAARIQSERAQRDRALAAKRNAQARKNETRAQVRQLVEAHRLKRDGEIEYAFTDGNRIKRILVDAAQRAQLAAGGLVIVRYGRGYEIVPPAAAEKIRERDSAAVVLDYTQSEKAASASAEDDPYKDFEVPDDLVW